MKITRAAFELKTNGDLSPIFLGPTPWFNALRTCIHCHLIISPGRIRCKQRIVIGFFFSVSVSRVCGRCEVRYRSHRARDSNENHSVHATIAIRETFHNCLAVKSSNTITIKFQPRQHGQYFRTSRGRGNKLNRLRCATISRVKLYRGLALTLQLKYTEIVFKRFTPVRCIQLY
jgi:hypothetical protein